MKQFTKWASREYTLVPRLFVVLLVGSLFVFLIPYALINLVPRLDVRFQLPPISLGIGNFILGGILVVLGLFYAQWSIAMQIIRAGGTPVPVIATQKLLASGPFKHCRNPMSFGTICLYLGIAIIVGSISSIIVVLLFTGLLLIYIKKIEERELEARFGQEYIFYKKRTPFIIPRPWS